MFSAEDKKNLVKAKLLLSKISNFDMNNTNGYNAALFNLKQSLELLGTLRGKGETSQENEFFTRTSYIRNALIHGVAILDTPAARAMIAVFINSYIPKLLNVLTNLSEKSSMNLQQEIQTLSNTMLYRMIASDNYTSNIMPNEHNLQEYKRTFEHYLQELNSIEFKDGDDSSAPTKKAAALNLILTLAEIAKQVKQNTPNKFQEICKNMLFILALAGQDRNNLAHAQTTLSIQQIKEIQSKCIQNIPLHDNIVTSTASQVAAASNQGALQHFDEQWQISEPTSLTSGRTNPQQQEQDLQTISPVIDRHQVEKPTDDDKKKSSGYH